MSSGSASVPTPWPAESAAHGSRRAASRRWTRWLGPAFAIAMLALVAWMARKVEWAEVLHAVRQLPMPVLGAALGLTLLSFLTYGCYDLLARRWLKLPLPRRRVLQVTMVCYAFILNLGSMVGGIALRLRLYGRLGLEPAQTARVFGLALATNWIGYAALAGGVFVFGLLAPPPEWQVSGLALRGLGVVLWGVVIAYLVMCAARHDRPFQVRGHEITLPNLRIAVLQIALAVANWLLVAAVVTVLLKGAVAAMGPATATIGIAQVLPVYLLAVVAGLVVRVPGGVGVLETVFVTMLAPPLAAPTVIAALLAYRAIYYLLPLALAGVMYAVLEAQAGRWRRVPREAVPSP